MVFSANSNNSFAHRNLGKAYFYKEEYNNSLQHFQKAHDMNPRPGTAKWIAYVKKFIKD